MPSRFPGMDPFIEMMGWTDFHSNLAVELQRKINPQVLPKYVARVQERVYIESQLPDSQYVPDVAVVRTVPVPARFAGDSGGAALLEPETYIAAMPEEHFEPYLEVRDRASNEVVTVIEVLSPTNKRRGSDGYREYRDKWREVLRTPVNLVEIDLLRGGERPATTQPLKSTTDYCVMVYRRGRRPVIDVYQWPLRSPLPRIPIPLTNGDPDAEVDLQAVLATIYDAAGYAYTLPYAKPLVPPARPADSAWIESVAAEILGNK